VIKSVILKNEIMNRICFLFLCVLLWGFSCQSKQDEAPEIQETSEEEILNVPEMPVQSSAYKNLSHLNNLITETRLIASA
jgi:hypothetical protein